MPLMLLRSDWTLIERFYRSVRLCSLPSLPPGRCSLKLTPFACSRVHQLRHLQEEVARSEGLPIFGAPRLGFSRLAVPFTDRRAGRSGARPRRISGLSRKGASAARSGRNRLRTQPRQPVADGARKQGQLASRLVLGRLGFTRGCIFTRKTTACFILQAESWRPRRETG